MVSEAAEATPKEICDLESRLVGKLASGASRKLWLSIVGSVSRVARLGVWPDDGIILDATVRTTAASTNRGRNSDGNFALTLIIPPCELNLRQLASSVGAEL